MTHEIKQLFRAFVKMPYYKNIKIRCATGEKGKISHESAIKNVLLHHGYSIYNPLKKLRKKEFNTVGFLDDMPDNTFVEQPFGTQSSPDFFIKAGTIIIPLEAKSSKASKPLYNSGGVKQGFYYIFCSKKTNSSTIYRGEDIITPEQQQLINEHIKGEKIRAKALNKKLKNLDTNFRGISFYPRPMICQRGGSRFTNYFTHQHKTRDEERVFQTMGGFS